MQKPRLPLRGKRTNGRREATSTCEFNIQHAASQHGCTRQSSRILFNVQGAYRNFTLGRRIYIYRQLYSKVTFPPLTLGKRYEKLQGVYRRVQQESQENEPIAIDRLKRRSQCNAAAQVNHEANTLTFKSTLPVARTHLIVPLSTGSASFLPPPLTWTPFVCAPFVMTSL